MSFTVTIENFDGPLDLMLHLIKEKELDIFNLDIAVLTDQYILYIHQMEALNLEIASEYLVQLASLIEYKSKKLLPNDKSEVDDNYQQQKENDLVKRLIEYKKYKEVSQQFAQLYQQRNLLHDKTESSIVNQWINNNDKEYENTSPYKLIEAMNKIIKRIQAEQPYEVSVQTAKITVEERTKQLKEKIKKTKRAAFTLDNVMEDCHDVYEVVVTFLSILDMIHDNYLIFSIKDDIVFLSRSVDYE